MNNKFIRIIIDGRISCYVSKSAEYDPYAKANDDYDWYFQKAYDGYKFTDAYRGFNPYSGMECIYKEGSNTPIWICDYVGYVLQDTDISPAKVYEFLKEGRGAHLKNCVDNLFSDFKYLRDNFTYTVKFEVNNDNILERADIYYKDVLVAQHIASGIIR
jgi:hypothetical protein